MYFLKIVNFSQDPEKEEPAAAAPLLNKKLYCDVVISFYRSVSL